ncbi:E3 ubiquitin-protein ligase TRIM39 isoform X1 [Microcaecilia unicolor]|uniref:E3 ubiquitin-protein ligase TRIM39-like isoform X1 n=1 Tax=Microcaecilia unicolor TaxID=1415580 RepID=A0A6P7XYJ4_9AMPH|nr:E3 ubiquitin-protein ligase TRIM39-like isoform X1 [Microcaecilia unicolor]
MAAATPAESLRDEASCSICLDYFKDPVTTDCGHNFCRSCITQSWEGRDTNVSCPQCRKRSRQRNLRPNRQLANMTEMVKKLSQTSVRPKEENLCEKHEEKLKLFCEEDQKIICLICRESRDHKSYTVIPIEEAVQEYKEKLTMHLKPLRKDLEGLLNFQSTEEKKTEELRSKTDIIRQKVESEFEELHQFLNKEKQILLSRLEEAEKKILQRMRENEIQIEEQSSSLIQLISKIEEKSQQPANELLKDVKDALSRFFDWLMEFGRYTVNVTLVPETAGPGLVLSEDRKSVRRLNTGQNVPDTPERFDLYPCVLGSEGFTSGRRYWEVEVGDDPFYILGVCKDSVRRKGVIALSPEEGFWTVKLWYEEGCWAFTSPSTELPLSVIPRVVGILLDYEAGKVSFYDAKNKSHLFTFTDTFTGKLRPFFMNYSEFPLRIRQVSAWN